MKFPQNILSLWKSNRSDMRRPQVQRSLRTESLEVRALLAVSGTEPAIVGTVFVDNNGNSQLDTGEGIQGVSVRLFRDDGDSTFESNGSDVQVNSLQLTNSSGVYEFDNLDPDASYFVQAAQTVGGVGLTAQVSALLRPGVAGIVIDEFTTSQSSQATPSAPNPTETRVLASEAIGGQRDLDSQWNAGSNTFNVESNPFNSATLQVSAGPGVDGLATIVWDGVDSVDNQISMGLNGVDLTAGGNTGIMLRLGAEPASATLTLRIYQNSDSNFSQATVTVPQTSGGTASEFVVVPFSTFAGNVQPSDVDAIRMTIDAGTAATDTEVAVIGAIGAKVANFRNDRRTDLEITKTDNSTSIQPLQDLTYTIRVSNLGPSDVQGARVVDNFPSSLTNVRYTSAPTGTVTGHTPTGTGNINDTINITTGSALTYTVQATVAATATGTIENTATVTAPAGISEISLSNNSATDSTAIVQPIPASLSGRVYFDVNNNGSKETSEPGIEGVLVTLTPQAGGTARTTNTDSAGAYSFTGLTAGSYRVRQTQPTAFRDGAESVGIGAVRGEATANDEFFAELASGNNATVFDFGEVRAAISKRDLLASAFR
ncbi:MAG: carboxypeptidase regulatory-like domain-containing protein [Planctomycetota bacterium]|nr:carboxypeptidase regulatory-like domain-containing protein [Planctomycetota bacterium]